MKRYTALAGLLAVMLLGLYLYLRVHLGRAAGRGQPSTAQAVLPKDDAEQIIVDPAKHTLTVVKPSGSKTLFLPDRTATIALGKNGTLSVTSPQWGPECRFFFGVHASDTVRFAAGADVLYFKKLDLGVGVADQIGNHAPIVFGQVSYNIWSNCRVGVAYSTNRYVGGTLTVRL